MRALVVALDALCALREALAPEELALGGAALLAELAGADAVRVGVGEELRPVRERDLRDLRHVARCFELRIPASQTLLKLALELRPDRVVLAGDGREGSPPAGPFDARSLVTVLPAFARNLRESGLAASAVVAPDLDAVKAAHAAGVASVELYTGALGGAANGELERLADAARLAAKLRLGVSIGGGIGFRTLEPLLAATPACERIAVGRALVARASLVGMDRAVRDLRAIVLS